MHRTKEIQICIKIKSHAFTKKEYQKKKNKLEKNTRQRIYTINSINVAQCRRESNNT